jgi:hypothetical protein
MFKQILELQERHLRLVERLHAREIDPGRFKTELTRLRRETERLRESLDEGGEAVTPKPGRAAVF